MLEWHTFLNSPQTWTFKGDFYCGIGTSVHRALQDWIPTSNPGVVLGHWRCRHCCKHGYLEECIKCKKKCSLYKEAVVGPQYCPKCGRRMIYEEFHYLLPKVPASGHSDGILLFDPKSVLGIPTITNEHINLINELLRDKEETYKFPAYILEYKTTTKARVMNITEPLSYHKAQATMYAGCCREILPEKYGLLNLDIKGIIIKYISRDSPELRSRDFLIKVPDNKYYFYNKKMIYRAVKGYMQRDIDFIIPEMLPCNPTAKYASYYADCSARDICSEVREDKDELLKILDSTREEFIKELKAFRKKFNHKFKTK